MKLCSRPLNILCIVTSELTKSASGTFLSQSKNAFFNLVAISRSLPRYFELNATAVNASASDKKVTISS